MMSSTVATVPVIAYIVRSSLIIDWESALTLPTKRASVLQHNPKGNYWFCVGKRTQ
jgi:hypothetical protein